MGNIRRVLIAQINHESSTLLPATTDLDSFTERLLLHGNDVLEYAKQDRGAVAGYVDAAGMDTQIIPALVASAKPAGPLTADAYESLLKRLIGMIKCAGRSPEGLDGIALCLHGSMSVEGIADGEGDLLRHVKHAAGLDVPVAVVLDFHANVTPAMVHHSDVLFGYDTNPHVDHYERAQEAFLALKDILEGSLDPVMRLEKVGIAPPLENMSTASGPMAQLFEMARRYERCPSIRNVSIFGGFPKTNVDFAGISIVVLANADAALAAEIGMELSRQACKRRCEFISGS